jgi:hypothetical protein
MICPKCGGTIHIDESCEKCGISYSEMIDSISHDEMLKLLDKLRKKMQNYENTDIEESLLAVELMNSSLLVPINLTDKGFSVMTASYDEGHEFIMVFTDKSEYEKHDNTNYRLVINPFQDLLQLVGNDVEGFAINMGSNGCFLNREFLDKYFLDNK